MRYYIVKPRSHTISENLISGILSLDKDAIFVMNIDDCDIGILQKGWSRSKVAVAERNRLTSELGKRCEEGYLYIDRYSVHLN